MKEEVNTIDNRNFYPLSVVIATLGGDTLYTTITHLNQGVIVPAEILICIPEEESRCLEIKFAENVKVCKTACRGQVEQRAAGFASASHPFVMQVDDDVIVDAHCIEYLLSTINSVGMGTAVAPALINKSNGESFYRTPKNHWLLNIYYWFINGASGYKPGCITRAGTNVGVDHKVFEPAIVEVEWLPGGCVLHLKKNLILENFYPFKGKAYSEDLIHSFYLKQKNIKLIVCTSAYCYIDNVCILGNLSFQQFIDYLKADFKARNYLVQLESRSPLRMYLYYMILILRNIAKRSK
jgi:hypothetical protein